MINLSPVQNVDFTFYFILIVQVLIQVIVFGAPMSKVLHFEHIHS